MTKSRPILLAISLLSFVSIGIAIYLQNVHGMAPCPLCILQRYAFILLGIVSLLFFLVPKWNYKLGLWLSSLFALSGLGLAARHLWIKAHPTVACGIDTLEIMLNNLPTAKLLPSVLEANGLCAAQYPPFIGLSIIQWSFLWFFIFSIVLITLLVKSYKKINT